MQASLSKTSIVTSRPDASGLAGSLLSQAYSESNFKDEMEHPVELRVTVAAIMAIASFGFLAAVIFQLT
jgi:hypothetical protein